MLAIKKAPCLPTLPGISGLSLDEIRSDLNDVAEHNAPSDTDSDGSILSEDVLPSHYPVKPRRSTGIHREFSVQEQPPPPVITPEIEEAIRYLRELPKQQADLCAAEDQREELELSFQAYTATLKKDLAKNGTQRDQQEAYLKLLQLLVLHALKVRGLNARKAMMLCKLHSMLIHTQKTSHHLASVSSQTAAANKTAFLLRVEGSPFRVVLCVGDKLNTPYGVGEILALPDAGIVRMKLPYGVLSMSLANVLACKLETEATEGNSLSALCALYHRPKGPASLDNIGLTEKQAQDLDALLTDNTDSEDDTGTQEEGDTQGDDDTMDLDVPLSEPPGPVAETRPAADRVNHLPDSYHGPADSGDTLDITNKLGAYTQPHCWTRRLRCLLRPPACHPCVSGEAGQFDAIQQQLLANPSALAIEARILGRAQLASTSDELAAGLNGSVGVQYAALSQQRAQLIQQINKLRREASLRSTEAVSLRLNMFTRRVAHRNHMAQHNIVVPSLPLAQQARGLKGLGVVGQLALTNANHGSALDMLSTAFLFAEDGLGASGAMPSTGAPGTTTTTSSSSSSSSSTAPSSFPLNGAGAATQPTTNSSNGASTIPDGRPTRRSKLVEEAREESLAGSASTANGAGTAASSTAGSGTNHTANSSSSSSNNNNTSSNGSANNNANANIRSTNSRNKASALATEAAAAARERKRQAEDGDTRSDEDDEEGSNTATLSASKRKSAAKRRRP